MKVKLDAYLRGFKSQDSNSIPQLPNTSKSQVSWASIPVRMFVDSVTGEGHGILLVAFSPRLAYVTKDLANQILAKYSNFKRIKFLPRRFLPAAVEEKIQVPIECLIGTK